MTDNRPRLLLPFGKSLLRLLQLLLLLYNDKNDITQLVMVHKRLLIQCEFRHVLWRFIVEQLQCG